MLWWIYPGMAGVFVFLLTLWLFYAYASGHYSFAPTLLGVFTVILGAFVTLIALGKPLGDNTCTPTAYLLGSLGVSSSIIFANVGAAYGTAKAGAGIAGLGVMRGDLVMRSLIPVVMAGVLGIYGLITSVILNGHLEGPQNLSLYSGYAYLGAGLTVGLSSLGAGYAIGVVGDVGARCNALANGKLFVGMILILIFAEALGLYGLIVGLVVASSAGDKGKNLCVSHQAAQGVSAF